MFHDCFKVSSSVFCAFCKVVLIISMGVLMMFLACFEEVGGIFQDCSKVLERTFQKCPIEVSRLFQRNFNNVSKVFQSKFMGVLRTFCFLILHGTHSLWLPQQKEGLFYLVSVFNERKVVLGPAHVKVKVKVKVKVQMKKFRNIGACLNR